MAGAMLLAVLYGISSSVQGPTNTALSTHVGRAKSSLVSFTGGALVLAIAVLLFGGGNLGAASQVPFWQLCTGALGFVIIISTVYSTPRLGIALTLMILMFAKLLTGACLDAFGLLGLEQKIISPMRLFGLMLVAAGIIVVSIGRMKSSGSRASGEMSGSIAAAAFMAISGMANAIQAPILSMLSSSTGQLEASFINFIGGMICALAYTLIAGRGGRKQGDGERVRPWQVLGGLYGACSVLIVVTVTPILEVGMLVSIQMCAQLIGSMIIDSRGWLGCKRIPVSGWRLGAIALIACGIGALAMAER